MFEKIGRLAETAATKVSVSRRGFLGRLGQGALAMTGVLGGMLAIPRETRAGDSYVCCKWTCGFIYRKGGHEVFTSCYPAGSICPYRAFCAVSQQTVDSCSKCK